MRPADSRDSSRPRIITESTTGVTSFLSSFRTKSKTRDPAAAAPLGTPIPDKNFGRAQRAMDAQDRVSGHLTDSRALEDEIRGDSSCFAWRLSALTLRCSRAGTARRGAAALRHGTERHANFASRRLGVYEEPHGRGYRLPEGRGPADERPPRASEAGAPLAISHMRPFETI